MAVSAARSKILPLPSAVARCDAVLKTFSKTRGTASTKVGLNSWRSRTRFLMSELWPIRVRDFTQPTWMIRAKTCARGRKSRVRGVRGGEQLLELVDGHPQLEHEVAVGEHAALGAPGRPRRVDERREVEGRGGRTPLLELLVADVLAEPGQHVDRVVGDRPDVVELVEPAAHLGDPRHVVRALGDHRPGAGVLEDPADLLGRRGLVDRHGHGPGEPDRVVEQRPLVAGLGDQGDPVAGLDAGRDQALGDGAHLGQERGRGDVLPRAGAGPAEDGGVGGFTGVGHHVVGEVAGRRHLDRQGRGELTHVASSGALRAGIPGQVTAAGSPGRHPVRSRTGRSATPRPAPRRGGSHGRADDVLDRHRGRRPRTSWP